MSLLAAGAIGEVQTYVSDNLENPSTADLKIVTRQAADSAIKTMVRPEVVQNSGLLALHQTLVERVVKG
jgi:hypothetical protein